MVDYRPPMVEVLCWTRAAVDALVHAAAASRHPAELWLWHCLRTYVLPRVAALETDKALRAKAEDRRQRRDAKRRRELSRLGGFNRQALLRSAQGEYEYEEEEEEEGTYGAAGSGRAGQRRGKKAAAAAAAALPTSRGSSRRARSHVDYTYASYDAELNSALSR